MHEMYDAGMLDVLVDIAESWDYEVVLVERKTQTTKFLYITLVMGSLARLVIHAQGYLNDCCSQRRNTFRNYLFKYAELSKVIWEGWIPLGMLSPEEPYGDRDIYVDEQGCMDPYKLIASVCVHTMRLYNRLGMHYPPICKRFPQVMFHLWQYSRGTSVRMRCLRSMQDYYTQLCGDKIERFHEIFFREVAATKADFTRIFHRFMEDFRDDEMWIDATAYLADLFVSMVLAWFRSLHDLMDEKMVEECLESLVAFCLRSLCGAKGDLCDNTFRIVIIITRTLLKNIEMTDKMAQTIANKPDFVRIIARTLPRMILEDRDGCVDTLLGILQVYGDVGRRQHLDLKLLSATVVGEYEHTLFILTNFDFQGSPQITRRAIIGWKLLGAQLRVSEFPGTEYDARAFTSPPKWKICAWKQCACHETHPRHQMRVCKGCWTARYCCAGCQKQDWNRG